MSCREEAQPKREFQGHQSTVHFCLWEGWQGIPIPRAQTDESPWAGQVTVPAMRSTPGQGLCLQHRSQGVTCKQCWHLALPHLLGKNISKHQLQLEMSSIFKLAANYFIPTRPSHIPKLLEVCTHTQEWSQIFRWVNQLSSSGHSRFSLLYQLYTAMEIKLTML